MDVLRIRYPTIPRLRGFGMRGGFSFRLSSDYSTVAGTAYPAITRTESFVLLSSAHRYSILVILDNFKATKLKSYTGRPRLNRCESLCLCKVRELVAF
jgi:hypothetical protein